MNTKPNLPEEIGLGKWMGSWRGSWNRGGAAWMFVVYLTDVPGAWLLQHHAGWPLALRLLISLVPLAATFLYVRGLARWIRGLDELDRLVVLSSFIFGTTVYLFLAVTWPLLARAGVFAALNLTHFHLDLMPFSNCTFAICLTYLLASIGYTFFKRRYQ
jgi:hypothetical protein